MADNSYRTSNLGPRVSFTTTKASGSIPGHFYLPSFMTFENAGSGTFGGTSTYASGSLIVLADVDPIKFSNITTVSPSSTFISDGHLSIVSHSGNSMVIAIRSGATTYRWTNASGGVV